ncbi:hypothetical protein [Dysgonomonas macrotermitis]|uniref:Uncharacterized protein n=1 Tax=Dysgonomonas macrotermitis TaxID=1346286 RepID=A0A1M5G1H8_9BACT|nr:hypothetical protein [Dysgonomonas macrotermitis]SHF97615.1 hypothetical protein SAMN05444362_11323 [Dysgonomonas macrotermitis]
MKTKLSPLEQLREEKARLASECAEQEEILLERLGYARDNWGRLLLGTVFPVSKSGLAGIFSLFTSGGGKKSKKKKNTEDEEEDENESSSISFGPILLSAAPLIWEMIQPMVIGLVVKKVQSLFSRKKKPKVTKKKKVSE